jgi:hypothetical protein
MPPQHCTFNFKNLSHHISIYKFYVMSTPIPRLLSKTDTAYKPLSNTFVTRHECHTVLNEADLEPADLVLPWEGACSACPCWCAGEWAGTGRLWMLRGSWWGWWSAWDDIKCWPNGTDTCRTKQKNQNRHMRSWIFTAVMLKIQAP